MSKTFVSNEGYYDAGDVCYDYAFEVDVTGSYPYGVEFTATTAVVARMCEVQEAYNDNLEGEADRLRLVDGMLVHTGGDNDREHISIYKADADGLFHNLGFGWVWHEVKPSECRVVYDEDGCLMPDAIIRKYEVVLQEIYDERTAGDYTFIGVLAAFLDELKQKGVQL